jgi:uncharacterized integral membrane protein
VKIIYLILLIVLAIFIATFSQFNSAAVHIQYYKYFDFEVAAYMLIFVSLLAGIIAGALWGMIERFRLNRTISRLNRTIRDLRKDIRSNEIPPIIENPRTSVP